MTGPNSMTTFRQSPDVGWQGLPRLTPTSGWRAVFASTPTCVPANGEWRQTTLGDPRAGVGGRRTADRSRSEHGMKRREWLAIGVAVTALSSVGLAVGTLAQLGSVTAGDRAIGASAPESLLTLMLGAALLVVLGFAHRLAPRHPRRSRPLFRADLTPIGHEI